MGVLFDSRPVHMLVQAPTTVWREQRELPPREHSCGNPSRLATTDVLLNWAPKNDSFGRLMLFRVGNLASETFVSKSLSAGLSLIDIFWKSSSDSSAFKTKQTSISCTNVFWIDQLVLATNKDVNILTLFWQSCHPLQLRKNLVCECLKWMRSFLQGCRHFILI